MPNENLQTIDETVSAFLRTLSGANKSAATITAYRTDLQQFAHFLTETNCLITTPADITRTDVMEFLSYLATQGNSGTTRARKLASLRAYVRFLDIQDLLTKDPTLGVQTPKKERGSRTALRADEYTKLLSLAGANPSDYAILQVFLQTGVRVSELCALTRADLDFEARQIQSWQGLQFVPEIRDRLLNWKSGFFHGAAVSLGSFEVAFADAVASSAVLAMGEGAEGKPAALVPYDLAREAYTRQLWAFEGFTSYYDDLTLVRSGVIGVDSYLELLGRTVTAVLRVPGRQRQSVAESSFDTGFNVQALLRAIFCNDAFYATALPFGAGVTKSVKWPVDYAIGSMRLLGMKFAGSNKYIPGGRCNGALTAHIDGDRVCLVLARTFYAHRGYTLPAVRVGRVRRAELGGRRKRER